MYKLKLLSFVLLLIALVGCAPMMATPSPAPASTNASPVVSVAVVQNVQVRILEAEPLQVNALIRSQLPDGVVQLSPPSISPATGTPSMSS